MSGWLIVRPFSPARSRAKAKRSLHAKCEPCTEPQRSGAERFEAVALLHVQKLYRTAAAMLRGRIQAQEI